MNHDRKVNYNSIMEQIIKENSSKEEKPSLLLHSCCAPCSSATLEKLVQYFDITIFFYNPNISPELEFNKRVEELKRFVSECSFTTNVKILCGHYDATEFYKAIKGYEHTGERGIRCYHCYELRLKESARVAKKNGFDYFTTTLSISPHKDQVWLNEIGERMSLEFDVPYLYSDFKKKNGYKRSIELSEEYHLYRQDYCGCSFSKAERELEQRK